MRDFIKLVVDNTNPLPVTEEQVEVKEDWLDREEPSILPDLHARAQAKNAQSVLDKAERKMSDDLMPTTSRPQLQKMYQQMVQQQHQGVQRIAEFAEGDFNGGGGQQVDLEAWDHGSIVLVQPQTEEGTNWLLQNTDYDPLDGPLAVEHRYGPDLLMGAHTDGLTVSLDGRIADAER